MNARADHDRLDPPILPFLLFSLLLHAGFGALSLLAGYLPARNPPPRIIELVALPPPEVPEPQGGRVVEMPPAPAASEDPNARLLSEHGSRAEREMIHFGTPGAAGGAAREPAPAAQEARREASRPEVSRAGGARADFSAPSGTKRAEEETLAELRGEIERLRRKRAELRRQTRARDAEIGRLRARAAEGPRGNGGVNEWFDDVTRGPETHLNTRAFEESRYYLDFKTSYGLAFKPGVVNMGLRFSDDPARRPRTILSIEVNADGTLHEAAVLRTSGYSALDRDALDAARRVFPFDRPPATLLGPRKTLRFLFEVIF